MLIDFNETKEITIPGMNGGTGTLSARMFMDEQGKIIPTKIHPGGSIGLHRHETSDDINYVLSGTGKAVCDGQEEILKAGTCHICKKGSQHSIENKKLVKEDFFILSSGLAGEVLQKYINYGGRIAIYGDYSHYTSKPLRDFIYESNKGHDVFFVATEDEAIECLCR